jgi:tetratricopeptide (TPR) repeat protein/tRNA A-37 threonylcarbamoyl transferase component Bud32
MSVNQVNPDEPQSLSVLQEIDDACDDFEDAWRADKKPRIEDYVARASERARTGLVQALLRVEIACRQERGDTILPGDYAAFPEHASLVETLLGRALALDQPIAETCAGRYRLEDLIGRGGMGDVYRAHDPDFQRPLAVKILKKEYKDRPEMVARFLEEARITGQLQHPGVPPVHEIGRLADGRPFLAMKLIEGRTLADLLAQRKDPSDGLPRFLTIFEQVCQTVAYAHARRAIHRDLKPANVMVGAFGEVQVMDWGLAKTLATEDRKRASSDEADRITLSPLNLDTVVGPTRAGQVMGTWAYMPPEQARGEVDKVDKRSDVFSLGATLCEILTGEPAYRGPTHEKLREQSETADLADAFSRLHVCGADTELIALAKKCLAAEMDLRPGNAGAVSDAVSAYEAEVQERLRKAELERAAAEVKAREGRKRLRVTVALGASLLALVLLAGGATWWYQHEQFTRETERAIRIAQTEVVVLAALSEFQARLDEAQEQTNDPKLRLARVRSALSAVKRAEEQLASGEGSEELAEQVRQARTVAEEEVSDSELLVELDRIRLEQATVTKGDFDLARAVPLYAAAMRKYGVELATLEAAAARVKASRQQEAVLAALEDWARYTNAGERKQLDALIRATQPAPDNFRARWRAARRDGPRLAAIAREEAAVQLSAGALFHLARDLRAAGELLTMEQLLRAGLERYPNDFWLNHGLGLHLVQQEPPRAEQGVRYLTAALALRSDSPGVHLNLGAALRAIGDKEGAIRHFDKALAIDPRYAMAHYNLGNALRDKGDLESAFHHYRMAVELDSKLAQAHHNLGTVLEAKGDMQGAIHHFQLALDNNPKLVPAHICLGMAMHAQGKLDEAIRHFCVAVDLEPKNAQAQFNLGLALHQKGDLDGAITAYQSGIQLDPQAAIAHANLGDVLSKKGRLVDAIAEYQKAVRLDPKLVLVQYKLGTALLENGQFDEAIVAYQQVIQLDPKHARAHVNLGNALSRKGRLDDAIQEYQKAIYLDCKLARAFFNLGKAMLDKGRLDEAIVASQQAIQLDPNDAKARINLGVALGKKGRSDEAISEFQQAAKIEPNSVNAHYGLARELQDKGRLDDAIAAYLQTIHLDPKQAEAHCNLGHALRTQGRFAESLAELKCGHELGIQRKGWAYPSAQWVKTCEKLLELDAKLPAVLNGDTKPADVEQLIGLAKLCQEYKKLFAAAAHFYCDAFGAEPNRADDLRTQDRYNAACASALASCGQGEDATKVEDQERTRLRRQALDWLRADLAAWTKLADDAKQHARIRQTLQHWQKDTDLAGIRDADAVVKLRPDEQEACKKLWADVEALLGKVREKAQDKQAEKK